MDRLGDLNLINASPVCSQGHVPFCQDTRLSRFRFFWDSLRVTYHDSDGVSKRTRKRIFAIFFLPLYKRKGRSNKSERIPSDDNVTGLGRYPFALLETLSFHFETEIISTKMKESRCRNYHSQKQFEEET